MSFRKLASLVIAGAMLVSALPMTVNAAKCDTQMNVNNIPQSNTLYVVAPDHGFPTLYLNEAGEYSRTAVDGYTLVIQASTEDNRAKFYFPETWTFEGIDEKGTQHSAMTVRGGDTLLEIADGKTITLNAGDLTGNYTNDYDIQSVGFVIRSRNAGQLLESLKIKGGTFIANAGEGDSCGTVSWAKDLNLKAGIATASLPEESRSDIYPLSEATAVPIIIDGSNVTADGKTFTGSNTLSYGIYNNGGTITLQNGATLKAMGGTKATDAASIVAPTGYEIVGKASVNYDGSNPVAFNVNDLSTYKFIDVKVQETTTKVEMTNVGESAVVNGLKNVAFKVNASANTYNSVFMKIEGDSNLYGLSIPAMTLSSGADVGIQVNDVPQAAVIALKLTTVIID